MEVIHTFPVNLVSPGNEPVLHAMQHDGVRQITAQLYAGATVWEVPNGVTAGIGYTLPNRLSGYYESLSDGTAACTVNGNTVTAVLAPILTSVAGEVKASIIFAKNGVQLSTFPFRVRVAARPGGVDSATRPDVASPFVGKLYYGGDNGLAVPLSLGSGVRVEQQPDGGFMLVAEGGGSGGGASPAVVSQMISLHNVERYAHEDIRIELRSLADRFNALANSEDIDLDQMAEVVSYIRSNRELIDAITTAKVSVADIVNNIVTNVSNKPLSAAMGVALAGEIDSVRSSLTGYQPKGNYLTQHQDISHLLSREELPEAVEETLAEAKESGTFDGDDGITPHIGSNGNWYTGGTDTGIKAQGPEGAPGYTPVRGTDYWTPSDQETIVQQVIAALGTPVFGRVDGENNIILTGELAHGTYTIKYEDADGNVTEIGTIDTTPAPSYTNVLPLATDKTGAVYNGIGYKVGARIGSGKTEGTVTNPSATNPIFLTGYIEVPAGATIRMKNCYIDTNGSTNNYNSDADQSYYGHDVGGLYGCMVYSALSHNSWDSMSNYQWNLFENFSFLASTPAVDDNGYITEFTLNTTTKKYIRMHLGGDPTTAIITVNEPITD